jgi:hypothetical protein
MSSREKWVKNEKKSHKKEMIKERIGQKRNENSIIKRGQIIKNTNENIEILYKYA